MLKEDTPDASILSKPPLISLRDASHTLFGNRKVVCTFADEARTAVKNMASDLDSIAPELKGDPSIRKGDHGVIAAASLAKILEAIGPKTANTFIPAVRAIAFHNSRYPRSNEGVERLPSRARRCSGGSPAACLI